MSECPLVSYRSEWKPPPGSGHTLVDRLVPLLVERATNEGINYARSATRAGHPDLAAEALREIPALIGRNLALGATGRPHQGVAGFMYVQAASRLELERTGRLLQAARPGRQQRSARLSPTR